MILSAKNITLNYSPRSLLRNISLEFSQGSFMGLLGKNGSGKTTLLKALAGIHKPQEGTICLDDQSLYQISPIHRARMVAMVTTIWPTNMLMIGRDILLLGRYPYLSGPNYSAQDDEIVSELANKLNIQELLIKPFFAMSDGQKQKIMIGRALAQKTKFLFLDEPFTYLDIKQKDWLFEFLRDYSQLQKVGILFSTHDRFIVDQLDNVFALDGSGCGAVLTGESIQNYLDNF
ncbi:MAG: ABC transporter ATP-binding protein [Bdellovibrio sp.]|nr:ABC transporter ATP-binding protein [Bdellovibrio sp.]